MVSVGSRLTSLFLIGIAAVAGAPAAFAQGAPEDSQDNQSVRNRQQPEYDPIGLPVGTMRLYPRIAATAEWNDNVFATTTNQTDDIAYTIAAGARLTSDWSSHFFALEGSVQDTTYGDSDEDVDPAWSLGAEGRLDIQRGFDIRGLVAYSDTFEPRGTNDVVGLAAPIAYTDLRGNVEVSKEFNSFRVSGGAVYSEQDYDDGVTVLLAPVEQDFRDRDMIDVHARADYALSPDTALFTSFSQRWFDYKSEILGNRDFERQRLIAGAAFDLTNLVRGEIGVGYTWAQYEAVTGVESPDGWVASGSLDWFLSRLTTVNLSVESDVGDSGDPGAPSRLLTDVGLRVDHELYRNIIVWGRAGFAREDYNGSGVFDRQDDVSSGSVGCDWLVNRNAAVQARYTYTERESSGVSSFRNYEQNRFTLGVTLRL